jgi:hypothetical protein
MGFLSGNRVFLLAACAGILAAGTSDAGWQKAFSDWTTKDAQQIMTDSPWAKQMPMPAAARPGIAVLEPGANGAPSPTASLGNPSNTTAGTNMTVAGNPGSAGPAEPAGERTSMPQAQTPSGVTPTAPAPEPMRAISIVWASAIPVRLAVLKLQSGVNAPTQGEIERVSKPRENYVIALMGLAPPDRDTDPAALATKAFLNVKGKPMVTAAACNYRKIGNADVYFFRFPRAGLLIGGADRQVEFKVMFGQAEIKHRFELKSMEYQGQLAL